MPRPNTPSGESKRRKRRRKKKDLTEIGIEELTRIALNLAASAYLIEQTRRLRIDDRLPQCRRSIPAVLEDVVLLGGRAYLGMQGGEDDDGSACARGDGKWGGDERRRRARDG